MAQITKEQIKRVYSLASGLGILESGNKNDLLHDLVFSVTNKSSVSDLTTTEFNKVQHELLERMKLTNHTAPLKKKKKSPVETEPDMMTSAQQSLAWRLNINFDRSALIDENAERLKDKDEVRDGLMLPWEYRVKWYGETEDEAKAILSQLDSDDDLMGFGGED